MLLPPANEVLGQGNVLHLSVSHSVDRLVCVKGSESEGCVFPGEYSGARGGGCRHTLDSEMERWHLPVEKATEEVGTHPTGFHPCLTILSLMDF